MGGEPLSNHELSVDELLLPLLLCCERCSSLPSLLEEEFWSEARLLSLLKEAFDRRRRLRSLRKEGIASDCVGLTPWCVEGLSVEAGWRKGYRRWTPAERWKPLSAGRCEPRREL